MDGGGQRRDRRGVGAVCAVVALRSAFFPHFSPHLERTASSALFFVKKGALSHERTPFSVVYSLDQLIVGEVQGSATVKLNNSDLRQRIAKVGIACPRGLARVDDLAAGIAGMIDARLGAGADMLHQPLNKPAFAR